MALRLEVMLPLPVRLSHRTARARSSRPPWLVRMLGAAMVTGVSLFGIACAGPAAETAASEPDISQSPTMPSEPAQTDASQPDSGEQTPTTAAAAATSAPTSTALAAQAEPTLVPSTPEPADQPPPFPDVVVPLVAGGQIDIGSLEGQDTVLWFWAPW